MSAVTSAVEYSALVASTVGVAVGAAEVVVADDASVVAVDAGVLHFVLGKRVVVVVAVVAAAEEALASIAVDASAGAGPGDAKNRPGKTAVAYFDRSLVVQNLVGLAFVADALAGAGNHCRRRLVGLDGQILVALDLADDTDFRRVVSNLRSGSVGSFRHRIDSYSQHCRHC